MSSYAAPSSPDYAAAPSTLIHRGAEDTIETQPQSQDIVQAMGEKETKEYLASPILADGHFHEDSGDEDHPAPTEEEMSSLTWVSDRIPLAAFFVIVMELAERFAYYGLSSPFQNYIQFPYDPSQTEQPGAIGGGQQKATALTTFFQFFCYLTPIFGAIMADQYWGKFRAIVVFGVIYVAGLLLLTLTSIPASILSGGALPGLVISMLIIGLATGGIKSNVSPLMAEQYIPSKPFVKTNRKGQKVIVDPAITIQSMFNWFYWSINVGGLGSIATTSLERYVGFWSAYLLPLLVFILGLAVYISGRKRYHRVPPEGSILLKAFRVVSLGIQRSRSSKHAVVVRESTQSPRSSSDMETFKNKFNHSEKDGDVMITLDSSSETSDHHTKKGTQNWIRLAKPSTMTPEERTRCKVTWDDTFVEDLGRTLRACKVFLIYPIFWVCYNQMSNNLASQAATMKRGGVPNDIMQNINSLALIIFIPIFDKLIYPGLRRFGIEFRPIRRIFCGFVAAALAMAYTAIIQHVVYSRGPNFDHPLVDANGEDTTTPNDLTVAAQIPSYILIAISEIFASITGLEYAFTKAPASMKSIVMSLFLFTNCGGSILGFAFLPAIYDPFLQYMYTILACITIVAAGVFLYCFSHYDKEEAAAVIESIKVGEKALNKFEREEEGERDSVVV
ncbi:peptide transporter ptr2 [Dispira simplex]|nr:peptide transporter ptr2 [Dispira simplex]